MALRPDQVAAIKYKNMSPEAKRYVGRKIRANLREGRPRENAIAIAYSQARAKGYRVPTRPGRRR